MTRSIQPLCRNLVVALALGSGTFVGGCFRTRVPPPPAVTAQPQPFTRADRERWERTAQTVTIHRDRYGIPHVFARTDPGAVFGFAYAQAEDNFMRIEDNFIRAMGRAAEVHGPQSIPDDRLNRALEIPRLAWEEYHRLDRPTRALVDAYADGVNFYLATRPEVRPRLLQRIEPWHPLAFIRYNYFENGFARAVGITRGEFLTAGTRQGLDDNIGSNGWVIGPSRSASGNALLFINPHLPFFGPGQVYEGHVRSDEGWNFTGYTRFGFPFPYVGHNETLGWVSTDNAADVADAYRERFDDPRRPLAYRYGRRHRIARQWHDTIRVRTPDGRIESRVFSFRATHHGPIVAERDGDQLAIRLAKIEDEGWLSEWYAMTRARNIAELKRAMRPLDMLFGNIMAADRWGNTWYLYNGAIPRRDRRFNWSVPVDGANPATEWRGYHSIDELPQLSNPPSGWMENSNSSPFRMTDRGNIDENRFPRYMVPEWTAQNARSQAAHRLLRRATRITLEDLARMAFDTRASRADTLLPRLFVGYEESRDTVLRRRVGPAIEELERWDRVSTTGSVPTTIFYAWASLLSAEDRPVPVSTHLSTLATALDSMESRWGTWRVPWGDVARLQRVDEFGTPSGVIPFSDDAPSLPVAALDGRLGAIFTMYPAAFPGRKRLYGTAGASYVSVVEFGPQVRSLAVHTFGASGDPQSPHFFDQAPLFARGALRPVWFTREDIMANLERSYRPGELP
jgi:acyl-homoserine lactone acylase PvdQ